MAWPQVLSLEEWIAIGSALVALLSLSANAIVVRRQLRLQTEEIRTALDAETARWCADVLASFNDVAVSLNARAAGNERAAGPSPIQLTERLSSLADLGRLYFPNFEPNRRGAEKPAAFRGDRQPAIDAVLLVHDLARALARLTPDQIRAAHAAVIDARRLLISEVAIARDPRRIAILNPRAARSYRAATRDATREIAPVALRLAQSGLSLPSFAEKPTLAR